jgi:hypothetical protein
MLRFSTHHGLREYDQAVRWMQHAVQARDPFALQLIRLPNAFPELEDHPEFRAMLECLDSMKVSL